MQRGSARVQGDRMGPFYGSRELAFEPLHSRAGCQPAGVQYGQYLIFLWLTDFGTIERYSFVQEDPFSDVGMR